MIEKDHNPKWKYKSVFDVQQEDIEYFINFKTEETCEQFNDIEFYRKKYNKF